MKDNTQISTFLEGGGRCLSKSAYLNTYKISDMERASTCKVYKCSGTSPCGGSL